MLLFTLFSVIAIFGLMILLRPRKQSLMKHLPVATSTTLLDSKRHVQQHVTPLTNFDWKKVEPIRYRPYETMQHVAMGIKPTTYEEWIRIDRGYLDRINERRRSMSSNPAEVFGTNTIVNPAIAELYTMLMNDFLPRRYPTIFKIVNNSLHNSITGSISPLNIAGLDHVSMLRHIGENVEEDFYIMCPDEQDELRLQGYIGCFPGGFLSPSRVGMSMREIHGPVPGYQERLGRGADLHLKRLQGGMYINRMNWSLQVDGPDLFRTDGNNYYPASNPNETELADLELTLPATDGVKAKPKNVHGSKNKHPLSEPVNIDTSYLRVERQFLTRLPQTRAIIFCVRSYLTPLEQIRKEGSGPLLADAIESMPEKLGDYKKRPFWREEVDIFLREGKRGWVQ